MKRVFTILQAIIAVMLVSGVNGQNFVRVSRANQEQTINLSTDQVLEIQLPRKAATGYTWCETNAPAHNSIQRAVAVIGDGDFIPDAATGTFKGGSGNQIIRYVGTSQGTTQLNFELRRQWEINNPAIDSYTITVVSGGKYTGTYKTAPKAIHKYKKPLKSTSSTLPTSWDWRSKCTPVKDQQNCGDCYSFAACGVVEQAINIIDDTTTYISNEWLTNCDTEYPDGCDNGGNDPLDMFLYPQGVVYNSEDPWTSTEGSGGSGHTGPCGGPYAYHKPITTHLYVPGATEWDVAPFENTKEAIYNYGPIFSYVDASSYSFNDYNKGIFVEASPEGYTDHCIVLVGWKDTTVADGSGGYWILRNSWNTDWGIKGYMYISYASDLVGQGGNYVVYKNGIPHTEAPVVNFGASSTSSCNGIIQFTDSSIYGPTSWLWDFGDGGTSTLENPSHTYTSSGTYNVKLKAYNSYGDSSLTKTNYITVSLPTAPTVTPGTSTTGGSVTLYASGTGTLDWYNAATGGTPVNTGTSLLIPSLTTNETFYVANETYQPDISAGMPVYSNSSSKGSYNTSTKTGRQGLVFTAIAPLTIDTVTVYEKTAGSRTIFLADIVGKGIDSVVTNVAAGMQKIALNFSVQEGDYMLGAASTSANPNDFWMETFDTLYPYTISNVISIYNCTGDSSDYYYYFYNWRIHQAPCSSVRVPVTATVITGINELSESNIEVYPNPANQVIQVIGEQLTVNSIEIYNMLGEKIFSPPITDNHSPIIINITALPAGMYFVEIKSESGVGVRKFVKE